MRRLSVLLSTLLAPLAVLAQESAPTAPTSAGMAVTARGAITQMHDSLGRVRLLLAKARDDRNPLTLTCVADVETRTRALLQVSRDDFRALLGGRDGAPAIERILTAASHAQAMELEAGSCLVRPELEPSPTAETANQGTPRGELSELLNPTLPWSPFWAVLPPLYVLSGAGSPPTTVSRP